MVLQQYFPFALPASAAHKERVGATLAQLTNILTFLCTNYWSCEPRKNYKSHRIYHWIWQNGTHRQRLMQTNRQYLRYYCHSNFKTNSKIYLRISYKFSLRAMNGTPFHQLSVCVHANCLYLPYPIITPNDLHLKWIARIVQYLYLYDFILNGGTESGKWHITRHFFLASFNSGATKLDYGYQSVSLLLFYLLREVQPRGEKTDILSPCDYWLTGCVRVFWPNE